MISIEAYRASIGRFSGKAKFLSQRKACLKSEGIDPALLLFLVMLLEVVLYGLIFMTMIIFYTYIMALFMMTVTYGYSFWIVKCGSELLSFGRSNLGWVGGWVGERTNRLFDGNKVVTYLTENCTGIHKVIFESMEFNSIAPLQNSDSVFGKFGSVIQCAYAICGHVLSDDK